MRLSIQDGLLINNSGDHPLAFTAGQSIGAVWKQIEDCNLKMFQKERSGPKANLAREHRSVLPLAAAPTGPDGTMPESSPPLQPQIPPCLS